MVIGRKLCPSRSICPSPVTVGKWHKKNKTSEITYKVRCRYFLTATRSSSDRSRVAAAANSHQPAGRYVYIGLTSFRRGLGPVPDAVLFCFMVAETDQVSLRGEINQSPARLCCIDTRANKLKGPARDRGIVKAAKNAHCCLQ